MSRVIICYNKNVRLRHHEPGLAAEGCPHSAYLPSATPTTSRNSRASAREAFPRCTRCRTRSTSRSTPSRRYHPPRHPFPRSSSKSTSSRATSTSTSKESFEVPHSFLNPLPEARFLARLQHPQIIRYYNSWLEVLEYDKKHDSPKKSVTLL